MGHDWWIFAALCTAVACGLIRLHRRRQQGMAILGKPEHYVTPELVEKILAHPLPPSEFREITILITNLTGYVPFCESAGDDEALAAINAHRTLLVPIIRKHKGMISDLLGDGTICLFGAPRPDPDHAASAVAAALELLRAHQSLSDGLRARGLPDLPLRIGIATGRVVLGDVGPQGTYGAMGNAMNVAMELQRACKDARTGLLISPQTADRIAGRFQFRRIPIPPRRSIGEFAFEVLAPLPQAHRSQTTAT